MDGVTLDWRGASAEAVGADRGISADELAALGPALAWAAGAVGDARAAGRLPHRELPYDEELADRVARVVENLRDECDLLIVAGPAASLAGAACLHHALNPCTYALLNERGRSGPQVVVLDAIDPDSVKCALDLAGAKARKTVVHVVDVPADAPETAAMLLLLRDLLVQRAGRKARTHLIVSSPRPPQGLPGSAARVLASADECRVLDVPAGVSGSRAALSSAALLSAGLCGADLEALLAGAADMDRRCAARDLSANPAALLAAVCHVLRRKGAAVGAIVPHAVPLRALATYAAGLWHEALGTPVAVQPPAVAREWSGAGRDVAPAEGSGSAVLLLEAERFEHRVTLPDASALAPQLAAAAGPTLQQLAHDQRASLERTLRARRRPSLALRLGQVSAAAVGQFIYLVQSAADLALALSAAPGVSDAAPAPRIDARGSARDTPPAAIDAGAREGHPARSLL